MEELVSKNVLHVRSVSLLAQFGMQPLESSGSG
jgi:hypothetical protein